MIGTPWVDATTRLADRAEVVINEFVAYSDLARIVTGDVPGVVLTDHVVLATTLCGFANFSSIAIQIAASAAGAGTSSGPGPFACAPCSAFNATFMTATIAGVLSGL